MENNTLPTAEEFRCFIYEENPKLTQQGNENQRMIEFAKLHCEEQKSQICHQMDLQLENSQEAQKIVENTYPLTLIK